MLIGGISLADLGIGFTVDGLVVGLPTADFLKARASLGRFVQGRSAGCKAVLARPI